MIWYGCRKDAERAEEDAIRDEHPRYNIRGNGFVTGAQARHELDQKFKAGILEAMQDPPPSGWIRAIREALGISQAALAQRLGISRAAAHKLECAEPRGGITVNKMDEVAAALDCTFVYIFTPKSPHEEAELD